MQVNIFNTKVILFVMSDKIPLVSILVPVYGVEKYIERCAVSLLEQTYRNLEIIFIDDCGKDNSIGILKDVIERYPKRKSFVKIIRHDHNRGLAAARNTAVAAANGDFVMHVDSDDWVEKDIVEKCVDRQQATGADLVMVDFTTIFHTTKVNEDWPEVKDNKDLCIHQLRSEQRWCIWATLIRRDLYVSHAIEVREGCNMGEDFHTSPRLSYFANNGIAYVHEHLLLHDRRNENSYTNKFNKAYCDQMDGGFEVLRAFFADKGQDYLDALGKTQIACYVDVVKVLSLRKGYEDIFRLYKERIKSLMPQYGKTLCFSKRILVLFLDCRPMISVIAKVLQMIDKK